MKIFAPFLGFILAPLLSVSVSGEEREVSKPAEAARRQLFKGLPVHFVKDIKPILEAHCLQCHHDQSHFTTIKFHTRKQIMDATKPERPVLIPGNARNSSFYLVTALPGYFAEAMPSQGHRLTEKEKEKIYRWIEQGAKWPDEVRLEAAPGTKIIKDGTL